MKPAEEEIIQAAVETLTHPIKIALRQSGKVEDERFKAFCNDISRISPRFLIENVKNDNEMGTALLIGTRLTYQAIPEAKELPPFLDILAAKYGTAHKFPAPLKKTLSALQVPAKVEIYIAPQCPFCPLVVGEIAPLALASDWIQVTIIDSVLFPGTAEKQDIRSVPTLILNDEIRWTGNVAAEEVVRMMLSRDPADLSAASLRNMIEEGGANRVAQMMMSRGQIFSALISLLADEKWSIRLGAMVVLETIAEADNALAVEVIDPIWEKFHGASDPVRGDILYLLGEIGHPHAIEMIRSVIHNGYADEVVESAEEALLKCKG